MYFVLKLKQVIFKMEEGSNLQKEKQNTKRKGRT